MEKTSDSERAVWVGCGDPNELDLWYDVYIFMAQLDVSITSIYLMHFTMSAGLIQKRKSETRCLRIVIPG